MQRLYRVISAIGLVVYLPRLLFKKGPDDRRVFIRERLGRSFYEKSDIWVHAVSVGETLACLPFLKRLKKECPGKKIVLSTTTYTGQKIARDKFPEADRIMYMPLDAAFCVKKVVDALRPKIFITVETELWPGLFHNLKSIGSRIIILNGRISNESFKGYRKIKFFIKNTLSNVDFFYMQGKADAERIIALGAAGHKVGVMGNFKFDIELKDTAPLHWLSGITNKIFLAASTHRGEEEIILEAYEKIKSGLQNTEHGTPHDFDLKLILAPRHPERFGEVADLLEKRGLRYVRRSAINGAQTLEDDSPDIILLDTIGELPRVFSKASAAFIGGSLVPLGGHNIMEPAYWSKPILFGPHMDNFPIAAEFLEKAAALRVINASDLRERVIELLTDSQKAVNMGRNARLIVDKNTGAVQKAIELVRGYIGTS